MRHRPPHSSARAKTMALSAALATGGAALAWAAAITTRAPSGVATPCLAVALAVAFLLAEYFLITVEFRNQSFSFTFAGVPLALGILVLPVHYLVIARVAGSLVAFVAQRVNWERSTYNAAAYGLEAAIAGSVVHAAFGTPVPVLPGAFLIVVAIIALVDQVMSMLVLVVIRIHGAPLTRRDVAEVLVPAVILSVTATVFAGAIRILAGHGLVGGLALTVLLCSAAAGYWSYARTLRQHRSLALVHDFVARSAGAESLEELAQGSLEQMRQLLRADRAELVITTGEEEVDAGTAQRMTRVVVADDGARIDETFELEPGDWVLAKAFHVTEPTLVQRGTKDTALSGWLTGRGARDAVVAPLLHDGQCHGVVTVLDRQGDTATFTTDDLALLQTLASHVAVALRGARLVERLSYEATHDSLTGLANRAQLKSRIAAVAEETGDIAVLLLDLDKFKEVNDVLGHEVGDHLLTVVASRLRAVMPPGATVARLGGDEFAVLVPDLGDGAADLAVRYAKQAFEALVEPVRVEDALLAPDASVGVAVAGATERLDLLRRADTAMYAAKSANEPIALYRAEMDRGRAERLALAADLRIALDQARHQFGVVFQPKIDLASGRVVSAEALVRWNHPHRGVVMPDRFVPIAETTGLVDRLTTHVLDAALLECARWDAIGYPITVAVNLSARNVSDPDLPARIAGSLERAGLPPERLILEITESSIVEDHDTAVPILRELAERGVCLSLDDFGTGYSSLSYLQQLPVDELKIDRTFVSGLGGELAGNARALIRSIAALGDNLGLRVVAEGIETSGQLQEALDLGCHVGQGYLIGRPIAPESLATWLTRTEAGARRRPVPVRN